MGNLSVGVFFSHSILLAVIIAIIRLKKMNSAYYPFLAVLLAGVINETISIYCIHFHQSNAANSNVYVLIEYLLILWQFYRWNGDSETKYYSLACAGVAVWVADNFMLHSLADNNSLFRVFYSLVIAFFSINQFSKLLFFGETPLWKNAIFNICMGFVIYFGFKAFVEIFNIFREAFSIPFLKNIWIILYFVNVIANLLYAAAMIWVPGKQKFIWRY